MFDYVRRSVGVVADDQFPSQAALATVPVDRPVSGFGFFGVDDFFTDLADTNLSAFIPPQMDPSTIHLQIAFNEEEPPRQVHSAWAADDVLTILYALVAMLKQRRAKFESDAVTYGYAAPSRDELALLAHELAHVVQQTGTSHDAGQTAGATGGIIRRQGTSPIRVALSHTGCNDAEARAIAEAIPGARAMVWTAITWMLSFNPRNRARVDAMLRTNFRSDSQGTFDAVKDRLSTIYSALASAQSGRVTLDCPPAGDPECSGRYVLTTDRSVHICPGFFNNSLHERQWMLIHEFAHVAGALAGQETYHAVFGAVDCDETTVVPTAGAALTNADNYSRFVWCLTQRPGTILVPVVP